MIKQYHRLPIDPPYAASNGDAEEWYPMLFVRLSKKHAKPSVRFSSILDTGSSFCLFRADIGRSIGVDVSAGIKQPISGVVPGASTEVYFHLLSLHVEANWIVQINAGFIEHFNGEHCLDGAAFLTNST